MIGGWWQESECAGRFVFVSFVFDYFPFSVDALF
jgi:hypothetical protein